MKHNLLASKQASKRRELWIDVLRGLGIILVVLGHADIPFKKFIYGFHVPLFFLISGYLWTKTSNCFGLSLKKNLRRFISPYLILCTANMLIQGPVLQQPLWKYVIGVLYSRGTTEWMPNCSPLWYMTCAFIALTGFELLQLVRNEKIKHILLLLCVTASASFSILRMPKLPWNIDTGLMGVGFISVGHMIRLKKENNQEHYNPHGNLNLYCIGVAFLVIAIISILYNPIAFVDFDGNRYGNVLLMITGAISMNLIIFHLCYWTSKRGLLEQYIAYLGKHTIFIWVLIILLVQ